MVEFTICLHDDDYGFPLKFDERDPAIENDIYERGVDHHKACEISSWCAMSSFGDRYRSGEINISVEDAF